MITVYTNISDVMKNMIIYKLTVLLLKSETA